MNAFFNAFWVVFTVVPLVVFAVAEGSALASRKTGRTYSENIRRWLGIDPPRPRRRWTVWAFATLLIAFDAWFVPHIVFGIWP